MRWSGNGLVDGTVVTSTNDDDAGNGDLVTYAASGTGQAVYMGNGFDVWGISAPIFRVDTGNPGDLAARQVVAQVIYSTQQHPTGASESPVVFRSTVNQAMVLHGTDGTIRAANQAGTTIGTGPVVVLGHRYKIDMIAAQNMGTRTTLNGRIIMRVTALDDPTWNTTGYWFYDSGYNTGVDTADIAHVRFGKQATSAIIQRETPMRLEWLGWNTIATDLTAVTTESAISAFFMPDPPMPLDEGDILDEDGVAIQDEQNNANLRGEKWPKAETVTDDFSTDDLEKWGNSNINSADPSVSGGQLTTPLANATTGGGRRLTNSYYDLTDSYTTARMVQEPEQVTGTNAGIRGIWKLGINEYTEMLSGGSSQVYRREYTAGDLSETAGAKTAGHQWYRIRHSAMTGLLYWETSADGISWTVKRSKTPYDPGVLTHVRTDLYGSNPGSVATTTPAIWDDFNLAPSQQHIYTGIVSANITNHVINYPTDFKAGDEALLIVQTTVASASLSQSPTTQGWTLVTEHDVNSTASPWIHVYKKTLDGTETGQVGVSQGVTTKMILTMTVWRGATFDWSNLTWRDDSSTLDSTPDVPAASFSGSARYLTYWGGKNSAAPTSVTEPAGTTKLAEQFMVGGGAQVGALAYSPTLETDGSVGAGVWTRNTSDAINQTVFTLPLLVPTSAQNYTQTPTDSAGLADSVILEQTETITDNTGLTDSASLVATANVTQTDSAGLTDSVVLTRSIVQTDSAGLTDTATLAATVALTQTDTTGLTDSVSLALTRTITQTDSAGLTDTTVLTRALVTTDSAGLTDAATPALAYTLTFTDSAGLTDSAVGAATQTVTQTDSVGLADTTALVVVEAVTDSTGLTDSVSVALGYGIVQTDSAGLTDSTSLTTGVSVTQTDTEGLTDSLILSAAKVQTDSAGLTDSIAVVRAITQTDTTGLTDSLAFTRAVVITDTTGLTDATAEAASPAVSDNTGLTDSVTVEKGLALAVTDDAGLTDSTTQVVSLTVTATDNTGLSDSVALASAASISTSDNAGLTDSVSIAVAVALTATDSAGLTDSTTLAVGRTLTFTDDTQIRDGNVGETHAYVKSDNAGLTDSIATARAIALTFTDLMSLTFSGSIIGDFARPTTDVAGLTDSAEIVLAGSRAITANENLDLTDSIAMALGETYSDDTGLTDTATPTQGKPFTDTMGLSDSVTIESGAAATVTDSAGLTDSITITSALAVVVTDSAGLTDTRVYAHSKSVTDSTGLIDTRVYGRFGVITDRAMSSDQATGQRVLVRTDAENLTDSVALATERAVTEDDDTGLTDSVLLESSVEVEVTDDTGLADATEVFGATAITDSAGLTDLVTLSTQTAYTALVSDLLGLTDTTDVALSIASLEGGRIVSSELSIPVADGVLTIPHARGELDVPLAEGSISVPTGRGILEAVTAEGELT